MMNQVQRAIYIGLFLSGVLLQPLVLMITDSYHRWPFVVGTALILAALIFAMVCLVRAKQYDRLRRAGLRLAVMVVALLVLLLIYR